MLFNKKIELVEENDLQSLIENKVCEKKTVEYKQSLPDKWTDDSKKEFLADVSSFANAAGGYIFYGIREEGGCPVELCGLKNNDVDTEKLRLEGMIRDGIKPRIPGVSTFHITLSNLRSIIIIHIPKSWALPHMVTYANCSRFYSRASNGKYQLDVAELRTAFLLSETFAERVKNFRSERLSMIVAGQTPVPVDESLKIILHIIPVRAFDPATKIDIPSLPGRQMQNFLHDIQTGQRYNFDGIISYAKANENIPAESYTQYFRNGVIEAVKSYPIRWESKRLIPSQEYEEKIIKGLPKYLSLLKELGVEIPIVIMLSLLETKGYYLAARDYFGYDQPIYIDRDNLLIPEIIIEDFDCKSEKILKPAFDAIWNAAGYPSSYNYDDSGNWVGQIRR